MAILATVLFGSIALMDLFYIEIFQSSLTGIRHICGVSMGVK